jgi:hypothetical protein
MNIFYIIGVVVVLAVVAAFFVYEKKALAEAARYYPRHPWRDINEDLRRRAAGDR